MQFSKQVQGRRTCLESSWRSTTSTGLASPNGLGLLARGAASLPSLPASEGALALDVPLARGGNSAERGFRLSLGLAALGGPPAALPLLPLPQRPLPEEGSAHQRRKPQPPQTPLPVNNFRWYGPLGQQVCTNCRALPRGAALLHLSSVSARDGPSYSLLPKDDVLSSKPPLRLDGSKFLEPQLQRDDTCQPPNLQPSS